MTNLLTYLLSCTVSEIQPSIGPKSLYLTTPLALKPLPPPPDGGIPYVIS